MTNRRADAIYFVLLLAVSLIAYYAARQSPDDGASLVLPDFHAPELVLEAPFDYPYSVVTFKSRTAPTLHLSGNVESVLAEIRSSLLESSAPVEVWPADQLVAITD